MGRVVAKQMSRLHKGNPAMRIPVFIISVASLIALGGLAQADDHLFEATRHGLSLDKALTLHDAPGRGSPFTAFEDEDKGIPSADPERTQSEHGQTLPDAADPRCPGCSPPED
jgi:hypothetical protein